MNDYLRNKVAETNVYRFIRLEYDKKSNKTLNNLQKQILKLNNDLTSSEKSNIIDANYCVTNLPTMYPIPSYYIEYHNVIPIDIDDGKPYDWRMAPIINVNNSPSNATPTSNIIKLKNLVTETKKRKNIEENISHIFESKKKNEESTSNESSIQTM